MSLLYADGGVIRSNPSPHGGTFAWVLVNDLGERIGSDCGLIYPGKKFPAITNNYSELFAAVKALSAMEEGWGGTFHSDSLITIQRMTHSNHFKGIPDWLRKEVLELRRNRQWNTVLVAGHPTKRDLLRGYKEKKNGRRYPVSRWNRWCDNQCRELAKEFMGNRK
jgi:ribonuclease HI